MKNFHVSLMLAFALFLGACGGTDTSNSDWCYTHNFGDNLWGGIMSSPSARGQWLAAQGIASVDGEIVIPLVRPSTLFNVRADIVKVNAQRAEGVSGDLDIAVSATVYGMVINGGQTVPDGYDDGVLEYLRQPSDGESDTLAITVQSPDGQIIINSLTLYGEGASPFGANNCNLPTETPAPGAGTIIPSRTPNPNECWGIKLDFTTGENFTSGQKLFTGTTFAMNYGFSSALTTDTPTFKQRTISVYRDFDPQAIDNIVAVNVLYHVSAVGSGAESLILSVNGSPVASRPFSVGLYQVLSWNTFGASIDEISIDGIVSEATSGVPGGDIQIYEIRFYGTGSEDSVTYSEELPTAPCVPTPTPAPPTSTPTPTPTGTPTACSRIDYDYRISAYDSLNHIGAYGLWIPGQGLASVEYHPNNFGWYNLYSVRALANGLLSVTRIEFHFSELIPGDNIGNWQLNLFSGSINVMQVNPTPATFFSWDGNQTGGSVRFTAQIGRNDGVADAPNPGGSAILERVTIWGIGTASGVQGVVTRLPCWEITPTPTPNITQTFTGTPTGTTTPTPTRTNIPFQTDAPGTPTRTPLVVVSPTLPLPPTVTSTPTLTLTSPPTNTPPHTSTRTSTVTPSVTATPPPTGTLIPLPTINTSATAFATYPVPGISTPAPFGTVDVFGTVEVDYTPEIIPLPTLATLQMTLLPTLDGLSAERGPIYDYLATAATGLNQLPDQIPAPEFADNSVFFSYAKWVMSGVALQELMGQKVYPIATHIFYGVSIAISLATISLILRFSVLAIKIAMWLWRQILKVIPFIGG